MRHATSLAIASFAFAAALGVAPAASATGSAPATAGGGTGAAVFRCDPGKFCIYSGWDGGGTRCQWMSEKVVNTADQCSFIRSGTSRAATRSAPSRSSRPTPRNDPSGVQREQAGGDHDGDRQDGADAAEHRLSAP